MALEIKQSLRLSQQLVMTPQLQQAIKLLQLNRMELAEVINQELVENPVLEEVAETPEGEEAPSQEGQEASAEEGAVDPEAEQRRDEESFVKPTPKEERIVTEKDEFNWESYVEEFNSTSSSAP